MLPDRAFFNENRADLYFLNSREVLLREGIDPVVTMEVFPNGDGTLCGMTEVLENLAEVLPEDATVRALGEGQPMSRKEVVLRIRARYSSFGVYETAYLGTLAQKSGWATAARACVEAAAGIPVISFGARHVHPAISDLMENSALVGGCSGCATPAGAQLADRDPTGTMPHALMLIMGDTLAAARAFDRHMPESIRRIVLVDTFMDEADESVRLAEAMGGRLLGVRLDTPSELGGVTPDLVNRVRSGLDRAGHREVKIYVSGGMTPERIREFVAAGSAVDGFGVGSAISGASPIDFTADIKTIGARSVAKRGRRPGLTENTRLERVR
ncbi:MAG: nicotinate phosphoribosyltransferase [Candidatus Latescibacteria bacterium]|nr:nicotinate phosphoribosyltransferase [Candidatus Latescibacterota bacterium]